MSVYVQVMRRETHGYYVIATWVQDTDLVTIEQESDLSGHSVLR